MKNLNPLPIDPMVHDENLPVARIASRSSMGRTEYEPQRVDEMAASMALVGQLQRIAVRPSLTDGYEVIYGELRLRAARQLGWETLDVRVVCSDDMMTLTLYASENLQRVELKLTDYLDVVLRLRDGGMSREVIGRVLARPAEWVADVLAVAREPVARAMANTGLLSTPRAWRGLMQLPDTSRRRLLESGDPITVASCEREAKRIEVNDARRQTLLWQSNARQIESVSETPVPQAVAVTANERDGPVSDSAWHSTDHAAQSLEQARQFDVAYQDEPFIVIELPLSVCLRLAPDLRQTLVAGHADAIAKRRLVQSITILAQADRNTHANGGHHAIR